MFAPRLTWLFGLVGLVCLLSLSRAAHASPLFELAGSSVGSGGFNARAGGASAASSYFNPALLPKAKQGLDIGWLFINDAINVTLDARSSRYDIPESALGKFGNSLPPVPTTWLNNGCDPNAGGQCLAKIPPQPRQSEGSSGKFHTYQVIGLVSRVHPKYLTLGLYSLVPYGSFTQAHSFFSDEREQYYTNSLHPELYSDRLTPVSLAFGAGTQILDWLSFGLSFTLSLENRANATAYVGNSADLKNTLQLSTKVDVAASVSPHFSFLFEPLDDLDISVTVHSPQKMVIDTAFGIYLPNGDVQYARRPATHAWMPWIIGLGSTYDVYKDARNQWALAGTVTYERWSKYVNRQTERPLKDYEWSDVFTGVLGVRYARDEKLAAYFDWNFHPTPVPPQTGRTNYVDNDRYGLLAGLSYDVPIDNYGIAFRFGGQAQLHILPSRHQKKYNPTDARFAGKKYSQLVVDEWPDDTVDISTGMTIADAQGLQTNNPGFPGFSSKGIITGGALTISLLY